MRIGQVRLFAAAAALAAACLNTAKAGELYLGLGVPGVGVGYAQPVNSSLTLRADFFRLGSRTATEVESGIRYDGSFRLQRAALLADWFVLAGSFRLTGGATFNTFKVVLDASGAGGSLTIGERTYVTTANDGLNVQVKFPDTTPYLGIGWGHQTGSGIRFSADLGASIGRATVSAAARGPLASQSDIQANIDKELAELRSGVGKVRALPQLTLGLGYSF